LPSKSTLFTYTTLFRSKEKFMYNYICFIQQNENTIDDSMFGNDVIYGDHIFNVFSLQQSVNHQRDEFFEDEDCVIVFHGQIYNLDRKSTRLNSSHVSIS